MSSSEGTAHGQKAIVALEQIIRSDDFKFRWGGLDRHHKADLAGHLRRTGKPFEPVLLWRETGGNDVKASPLVLLDGEHRIAAYQTVGVFDNIPSIILHCDRRTAILAALSGNSKRFLPLSQAERTDAAWRLVRETVKPPYTRKEIVGMASVSARTVNYMRSRWAEMLSKGQEPTGEWWRDRSGPVDEQVGEEMTDARREREIAILVSEIRDIIDRRKRPDKAILRDGSAVGTAIIEALGDKRFKDLAEYFFGDDEDRDEWCLDTMSDDTDVLDDNAVEDAHF